MLVLGSCALFGLLHRAPVPLSTHAASPSTRRVVIERTLALGGLAPVAHLSALLPVAVATTAGGAVALGVHPSAAAAAETAPLSKVVVLGGSGFVGTRICERLVALGVPTVISISRSGRPASAPSGGWGDAVQWVSADASTDMDALSAACKGSDAVISAIGVIFGGGPEADRANNAKPNVAAARAAAAAGAKRFVYVSVSEAVGPVAGPLVGDGYFLGKADAESAIVSAFSEDRSLLIKPSFIYGGDGFSLSPPRVSGAYGGIIDGLLSSAPLRALSSISPGPIALALAPPVSVDAVAGAAIAGALGKARGTIDGHDAIVGAAAEAA